MTNLDEESAKLGVDSAPGQELRQKFDDAKLQGEKLDGVAVDFSHGDVNAFPPIPNSLQAFVEAFERGAEQAYTRIPRPPGYS